MKCEICNKKLKKSFTLGNVPLADNLKKNKQDSLRIKKYPVTIFHCKNCQTLFQKKVINKKKLFHKEYHYRTRFTKDVLDGMKSLVQKIKKLQGIDLREKKILDIGCNDGSLLNFFEKESCKTYGIEPTNVTLQLIDPEEEKIKEQQAAARHDLSKKEGEAQYSDPIAKKLWGAG
jgi:2-polyprenyl-3-methyl-5-hydroxy-6-metoxy-1,4-benzoquinol methylase